MSFSNDVPRIIVLHGTSSASAEEEGDDESNTTFTLSFGNVEFCLTPDTATDSAAANDNVISISKMNKGEVLINMKNFSGRLHVKNLNAIIDDDDDTNTGMDTVVELEEVVVSEEEEEEPTKPPQSKASRKFDQMLANFRLHSEADFNLVPSARYRGLLRGTSAAIEDPAVITAFRVLYEDLGPIRVAGDLIFSKLEREITNAKSTEGAANVKALGRDDACVIAARKYLMQLMQMHRERCLVKSYSILIYSVRWDNVPTALVEKKEVVKAWQTS